MLTNRSICFQWKSLYLIIKSKKNSENPENSKIKLIWNKNARFHQTVMKSHH